MIGPVSRRAEFADIRSNGIRVRQGSLRMTHLPQVERSIVAPAHQLAFALSRKFGSAVERNRAKRRLRAVFANQVAGAIVPSGKYLIVPSRRVLSASVADLNRDLSGCIHRLGQTN